MDNHGTRTYIEQMDLLAYLDPGDDKASTLQWVLLAAILVVLLLAVVYGLTRFVKWAARR